MAPLELFIDGKGEESVGVVRGRAVIIIAAWLRGGSLLAGQCCGALPGGRAHFETEGNVGADDDFGILGGGWNVEQAQCARGGIQWVPPSMATFGELSSRIAVGAYE